MARSSICLGLVICMCSPLISRGFEGSTKAQAAGEPGPAADWPKEPAALLKRLKTRNAEFDNRSVETERR
jgi:hypothetical protein